MDAKRHPNMALCGCQAQPKRHVDSLAVLPTLIQNVNTEFRDTSGASAVGVCVQGCGLTRKSKLRRGSRSGQKRIAVRFTFGNLTVQ